ncbi:hypothetical protein CLOSTASPAR_00637 [[Clostridium] asparagiforme DSM 15981]|uniref:Uncharacterized protein n=1 Tax=[Clostridium] asparagiforme DSM 15981 TaxID=518636 RepID=C0CUU8_9FIRM|nr:hypothetical protein CLOSTASPAR_00637 [[Clostridium] asparagiforme DSM 15981]
MRRPQDRKSKKFIGERNWCLKMRDGKRKPGYEVQSEPDWGC